MGKYYKHIDHFAEKLSRWVITNRLLVIFSALIFTGAMGYGASYLGMASNYRVFFSEANPELQTFERFQNTYTKNDNFFFAFAPKDKNVFSADNLAIIEDFTATAWRIPYAIRVDSITNFQHTYAEGDDLVVEDLIRSVHTKSQEFITQRKEVALNEPLLLNQLITEDASVTAVNVVLQYPELSENEVPEAIAVARAMQQEFKDKHPDMDIYLTGVSALNNSFAETGMLDGQTLMPLMFLIIFILAFLFLRSLSATFTILIVIALSTAVAMGFAGYAGIKITPISMSAPIVILTLAVADSIHIFISLRQQLRQGKNKFDALIEAVRINFVAVSITSVTTIVGFLTLNFSDSPPFWDLGNITAVGILSAWLFSLILIPAIISLLPFSLSSKTIDDPGNSFMAKLAEFVIRHYRKIIVSMSIIIVILVAFIPTLKFNDQWVQYFDERIQFRVDSDQVEKHFGMYPIEYSVPAKEPGGVSEPEYLRNLELFANFLADQPIVTHVYSFSDVMKRLNKNMHEDSERFFNIPNDRDLSAQYLLLYELSLPYGLDLNDRINVDKSASRVTVMLARTPTAETKAFFNAVDQWQRENWPDYMQSKPTSAAVMFTYISERNLKNMITGTIIAVLAIALIMVITLRSVRLGLLSLIPNALPILATFGTWALLVGNVGFSIASVASISLGIIVDDSVHFLTKFLRARQEEQLNIEDAIRYAFKNVGVAIIVNTIILTAGFLVMTSSAFKLNVDLGLMTVIAILFALLLDFLLLPALLLLGKRQKTSKTALEPTNTALA